MFQRVLRYLLEERLASRLDGESQLWLTVKPHSPEEDVGVDVETLKRHTMPRNEGSILTANTENTHTHLRSVMRVDRQKIKNNIFLLFYCCYYYYYYDDRIYTFLSHPI